MTQTPDILTRLKKVTRAGRGWLARCPAHDDGNPSLSISEGRDGKVLLFCHAGCSVDAIVSALGLEKGDLFAPDSSPAKSGRTGKRIVAVYDYVDLEGKVRFQVVRYEPKTFSQRQPDPTADGGYNWKMDGVTRCLYRLPEVSRALEAKRYVFLTEGEKDADRLAAAGLCATTNPGGAKKWRAEYSDALRGASVVLLPDNDKAGHEHRDIVTSSLHGIAGEVRVVHVPRPHKDVGDWFDAGGTLEQLKALVLAAALWIPGAAYPDAWWTPAPIAAATEPPPGDGAPPPSEPPPAEEEPLLFPLTDLGNAERFAARHGENFRYVPKWESWVRWTGKRWERDTTFEAQRAAVDTVRAIAAEADTAPESRRKAIRKWAHQSESASSLGNLLKCARSAERLVVAPDRFDRDAWLLTLRNGTLDLRTGKLRPHARADLATKLVDIDWDPEATCARWEAFLDRIMDGNAAMKEFLQRAAGYGLTASTKEQVVFLLYGMGANGKSTFLEAIRCVAGEYATNADFASFLDTKAEAGRPRSDLARLFGARIVTASEAGEGRRLGEDVIKRMTGGEPVTARFPHEKEFEFVPQFKIFLASNHKPVIRGTDGGIWRRIRLVPFTVQIPIEERDGDLLEKLKVELPGILAWVVAGCLLWQRDGLTEPTEVLGATESYRVDSDTLGAFLGEWTETTGGEASERMSQLYLAYSQWAEDGGEYRMGKIVFGRKMAERGWLVEKRGRAGDRESFCVGIRLTRTVTIPPGRRAPSEDREPDRQEAMSL